MYNTAEEIIQYIGNAKKHTPVKVYVKGKNLPESDEFHIFGDGSSLILIGDIEPIQIYLEKNKARIQDTYWEHDRRNSAIPMLDITHINALSLIHISMRIYPIYNKKYKFHFCPMRETK